MSLTEIYTIGVFGSSEAEFFQKLTKNNIDTFVDIRQRRGVRGAEYAFVNSLKLQKKLESLSIQYRHEIRLAPTSDIRETQYEVDDKNKIAKRKREILDEQFIIKYEDEILSKFEMGDFLNYLDAAGSKKIVLFCVEKSALACHRSIVCKWIQKLFPRINIINL